MSIHYKFKNRLKDYHSIPVQGGVGLRVDDVKRAIAGTLMKFSLQPCFVRGPIGCSRVPRCVVDSTNGCGSCVGVSGSRACVFVVPVDHAPLLLRRRPSRTSGRLLPEKHFDLRKQQGGAAPPRFDLLLTDSRTKKGAAPCPIWRRT